MSPGKVQCIHRRATLKLSKTHSCYSGMGILYTGFSYSHYKISIGYQPKTSPLVERMDGAALAIAFQDLVEATLLMFLAILQSWREQIQICDEQQMKLIKFWNVEIMLSRVVHVDCVKSKRRMRWMRKVMAKVASNDLSICVRNL